MHPPYFPLAYIFNALRMYNTDSIRKLVSGWIAANFGSGRYAMQRSVEMLKLHYIFARLPIAERKFYIQYDLWRDEFYV